MGTILDEIIDNHQKAAQKNFEGTNWRELALADEELEEIAEEFDKVRGQFVQAMVTKKDDDKARARQMIIDMLDEIKWDTLQVFDFGAKKHPDSSLVPNFLTKDGSKCSLKERGSGVLRHGARTFMNPGALDDESGLPELLHLIASCAILYIRNKRNIIHPEDE